MGRPSYARRGYPLPCHGSPSWRSFETHRDNVGLLGPREEGGCEEEDGGDHEEQGWAPAVACKGGDADEED